MTAESDTQHVIRLEVGRLESVQLPADADLEWLRALYEPKFLELRA